MATSSPVTVSHPSVRCLEALEEKIVDSLEPSDLDALSTKAAEMEIVSSEVKRKFDSLDPGVPRPRKIRYLLIHAYEQLEANSRKLGRWLKVLHSHGVPSDVLRNTNADTTSVRNSEGDKHSNVTKFHEEHVTKLVTYLAKYSDKWRNICMSLNLPRNIEKNLEARLHMYDNIVCLREVLHEWIVGNHKHAKAPTLDNLKEALASDLVGLGKAANQLDKDTVATSGLCSFTLTASDSPHASSSRKAQPELDIVSKPINTMVAEEKSTLFEVEAVSTCGGTISYQWVKDGCPLKDDGEHYLGSNRRILCITANLATEGTYTCELREPEQLAKHAQAVSKPAELKVNISHDKKILMDMYRAQSDVHKDAWPPVSNKTYINLALVVQEEFEKKDAYSYSTIQGDVDNVVYKKESIGYSEAFGEHKNGALLLIEGRPGSGKTTLVHKVSEDWATGKPILKGARLVFLISLRMLSTKKIVKLADIMKEMFYRNDDEAAQSVLKKINSSNGEDVCFILDGLDEYETQETQESVISELIQRDYLQQAMVILSSRPSATITFRKKADVYIEVIGFLKNQIEEYIQNYPFTSVGSAESLLLYLEHHPNVLRMCYLPVHVAMVSFLHDKMEDGLPSTESGIYKIFTKLTLLRKDGSQPSNSDVILMRICELAFHMTVSHQQVSIDKGSLNSSLGLVTIDCTAKMYGYDNLYTFVHLTFQEYLAAYYISKLGEQEQREIISKYGHVDHMRVVWRFYCGLVSFENRDFTKILELHEDLKFHCQCAFESQQPATCKSVVLYHQKSLRFSAIHPADFTCLWYVVANSCSSLESLKVSHVVTSDQHHACTDVLKQCSQLETLEFGNSPLDHGDTKIFCNGLRQCCNLSILNLCQNSIGNEGAKVLGDCLGQLNNLSHLSLILDSVGDEGAKGLGDGLRHCSKLSVLDLDVNEIGDEGAKGLSDGLKYCSDLSKLSLCNNSIGDEGAKRFGECLGQRSNLSKLYLDSNRIGNEGAKGLSCGLRHCSNLSVLRLSSNNISDDGAKSLSDSLKLCNNLSVLHLDGNRIGDEGAKGLSNALMQCSNLSELCVNDNCIGDEGAKCIGYSLSQCINLSVLNLDHNIIGDEGAKAIGDGLSQCRDLSVLKFSDNKVGDEGAKSIGNGVRQCSNLSELQLHGNKIGDEGVKFFGADLKHCSNLSDLCLGSNKIGDEGAKCLGECLRHCDNLSVLNLQHNKISDEGAKGLADGLRQCNNLSTLLLNDNKIGVKGKKCLCESIAHVQMISMDSLTFYSSFRLFNNQSALLLNDNEISDEDKKSLCEGLEHVQIISMNPLSMSLPCQIS